jgi:gliding motility-associated-like protein
MNLKQRGAVIALLCFLFFFQIKSQSIYNLVNNSSFEDTIKCPNAAGQVYYAKHWFNPNLAGSPDYFSSCANSITLTVPSATFCTVPKNALGFQIPNNGNCYQGFAAYRDGSPNNFREYIKNKFKNRTKINQQYCVTFYVSCSEYSRYATHNIGFYFSSDSMLNTTFTPPLLININPIYETNFFVTDTVNWTKIQTLVTNTLTNSFITIGNFRDDVSTVKQQIKPLFTQPYDNAAYYYIDNVSVVEINSANAALNDTLISRCFMDSVILGTDSTEFATYAWSSTAAGLAALSCTNCPNPIAKPLITTKYYLTKQQCSATTMDSVTVVVLTPTTQANAGNDKTICLGDVVQIGTQDSLAFTNYTWQNATTLSCTNCAMPFANPNATTTYTVQRTECATITTDTVKIIIDDCDPTFVLPNVFTPNGDEINDTWGVNFSTVNSHISNFKMSIYDRWGLLVYSTNPEASTPKSKWDGRTTAGIECNAGVYFYVITFSKNEEQQKLSGHLSLFR